MKFTKRFSPNYHNDKSTLKIMIELTIGLAVVMLASFVYYQINFGFEYSQRILVFMLIGIVTNIITEVIIGRFKGDNFNDVLRAEFPWVTGMILALTVSINTTYYALIIATIVAVIFAKVVFGGFGQNVFNPAGVGRALIASGFATAKLTDVTTGATPTSTIANLNWLPTNEAYQNVLVGEHGFSLTNLLLGNHCGEVGETFALIILIVGIVLAIRKVIDFRIPLVYLTTIFILASIIGFSNGVGLWYPTYHVLTGGAMFAAVFMLTDPVTSPTQGTGKILYAMGAGILTILIRLKGNLPEGVVFSILLMNMFTPLIEDLVDGNQIKEKSKYLRQVLVLSVLGIALSGWIAVSTETDEGIVPVDLGESISISDDDVLRYQSEIQDVSEKDGAKIFTVLSEGYAVKDDEHTPNGKENKFIITVVDEKITSIEIEDFNDTKGIGDQIDNISYFENLYDKDLTVEMELDTVTGATKTSYSLLSAIHAVTEELNK